MTEKLLFVYNADSGLFSTVSDFVHKVVSPETYSCNLCKLTYGNLGIKKQWKQFLDSLVIPKEFLHRNEFIARYPEISDTVLPAVFLVRKNMPVVVLSASEIQGVHDLEAMQNLLIRKIKKT